METQQAAEISREELEQLALMAVSHDCHYYDCEYHDLVDYIDIMSDDTLWGIIENREVECKGHRK